MVGNSPSLLVLGSMPSVASLEEQQYYAHPRNAFWPLMAKLLGFDPDQGYAHNVTQATDRGIAIWDVIGECVRPGSLDSAIVSSSVKMNPIPDFLAEYPGIQRIILNGGTAGTLFKRHCQPLLDPQQVTAITLPSTSPANARMDFAAKCAAWQAVLNTH